MIAGRSGPRAAAAGTPVDTSVAVATLGATAASALVMLATYRLGPAPAVAGMLGVAVAVLALTRPIFVFYLGLAALPLALYTQRVGPVFLNPTEALLLTAAVGYTLSQLARGESPVHLESPLAKPFVLSLLAIVPGLALADDPIAVAKVLGFWTVFFLLYEMFVHEGTTASVRTLLLVLVFAGAVSGGLAVAGIDAPHPETADDAQRATGQFLSPNAFAAFLTLILPAALALGLHASKALRPALFVAAAVMAVGIFLSGSRGGMLAVATALAIVLLSRQLRRATVPVAGIAVAVALVAAATGLAPALGDRVDRAAERLTTLASARNADPRLEVWRDATPVIAAHPFFGVGAANLEIGNQTANPLAAGTSEVGVAYNEFGRHAHNIALTLMAERGILGLAAMIWLAVALVAVLSAAYRRSARAERALVVALAAAFAGLGVQGVVDYTLGQNAIAAPVMALAACAAVLARPRAQGESADPPGAPPRRRPERAPRPAAPTVAADAAPKRLATPSAAPPTRPGRPHQGDARRRLWLPLAGAVALTSAALARRGRRRR